MADKLKQIFVQMPVDDIQEDSASLREEENKIKENLGICITITGIVLVAIIITTIKIILYDKDVYPSVFYSQEEIDAMNNVSWTQNTFHAF